MAHVVAVGVDDADGAGELWRGPALSLHGVGREVAGAPGAGRKAGRGLRRLRPTRVLEDVSGVFPPGRMCALMGPSGAGKSTLLEAASGRSASAPGALGKVLLGGRAPGPGGFGRSVAYVAQHEALGESARSRAREGAEY